MKQKMTIWVFSCVRQMTKSLHWQTFKSETSGCLDGQREIGPNQYGNSGADAVNNIKEKENSDIRYVSQYSIYNILNVVIKYV